MRGPLPGNDEPIVFPSYRRQLVEFLRAFDALSAAAQRDVAVYLGLWAAMETSRDRQWRLEEEVPAMGAVRVLGEGA